MNIIELLNKIDLADDTYYNNTGKYIISDIEYEKLKTELREFDTQSLDNDLVDRISKTLTRIGAPLSDDSNWEKYNHLVPMGSLSKINTPEEAKQFLSNHKNKEILVTEKLDGISVSLRYENGFLQVASTRGFDDVGEDITRNVRKMKGVLSQLSSNFTGHIRGEIILRKSDFNNFPDMANTRNAASGIAKRTSGEGSEHLSVIAYTYEPDKEDSSLKTEEDYLLSIKKLGLTIPNYKVVSSTQALVDIWQEYMNETRVALDYDIDGLVFSFNDKPYQLSLGQSSGRPNGMIAFKFEAEKAQTTLRDVIWQVGDSGVISPVALFDKVYLCGSGIERATLHNCKRVKDLGLTKDCIVIVFKANDVIPAIEKVVSSTTTEEFNPPTACPCCGSKVAFKGEYLYCTNKSDCPAQLLGSINKWVKELNILEWGEKNIQKMIDAGLVKDISDIYCLTVDDIANLDRMGQRSAENLIAELDKFREIPLENFIGGLSIGGIATSTVKQLISAGYDTLDKLRSIKYSQIVNVDGFGSIRANAFIDGMKEKSNLIDSILSTGVKITEKKKGNLNGTSVCFTGSLSQPRAVFIKMVEDNGGEYKKSVGRGLHYLVTDNPSENTSKLQAARKNGTKIISEEEFLKIIG